MTVGQAFVAVVVTFGTGMVVGAIATLAALSTPRSKPPRIK